MNHSDKFLNNNFLNREHGIFDIFPELEIRKILEKHTGSDIEIHRNKNPKEVDLKVYKWDRENTERIFIIFIEIEVAKSWGEKFPSNWKYYSYLKRKVYKWNFNINKWDGLKENLDKTIYLRLNEEFSDGHCMLMSEIVNNCKIESKTYYSNPNKERLNTYLRILKNEKSSKIVHRGLKESITFIKKVIEGEYMQLELDFNI